MSQNASGDAHCSVEWLDDGAIFRIERPAKLNAITKPVLLGLTECIDTLEARKLPLLVIAGRGEKAFCAGTDLGELQGLTDEQRAAKTVMARELLVRLSRSRLISVAALNGLAYGGGLELAMACMLRIALPHVRVSLPEIKLGLLPAYAGTQFLPAIVGPARATELMLTGRPVAMPEAQTIGLVHRVADEGTDIVAAATAFGREISGFSPSAVAGIRACIAAAGTQLSDAGLAVEDHFVRAEFGSYNAKEGVAAFLEKRKPNFRRD